MLNSRLFESVGGFKGLKVVCAKKENNWKKIENRKKLLGCQLSVDKQSVGHLKRHISHIIYLKFGQ
jgi:hypothetical protein